jgi:hypothetical protein
MLRAGRTASRAPPTPLRVGPQDFLLRPVLGHVAAPWQKIPILTNSHARGHNRVATKKLRYSDSCKSRICGAVPIKGTALFLRQGTALDPVPMTRKVVLARASALFDAPVRRNEKTKEQDRTTDFSDDTDQGGLSVLSYPWNPCDPWLKVQARQISESGIQALFDVAVSPRDFHCGSHGSGSCASSATVLIPFQGAHPLPRCSPVFESEHLGKPRRFLQGAHPFPRCSSEMSTLEGSKMRLAPGNVARIGATGYCERAWSPSSIG